MSRASLVLIPVNPDVLACKTIQNFVEGLNLRLKPMPLPRISVFMNKARTSDQYLTPETRNYLNRARTNLEKCAANIEFIDSYIPERLDLKAAIPETTVPAGYEEFLNNLWNNLTRVN